MKLPPANPPAGFRGRLVTWVVDELKDIHELEAPFAFYSALLDQLIWVPKGFRTDFASVPRIVGAYLMFGGKGRQAAVIHDLLYSLQLYSREVCDAVFEEALVATGYNKFTVAMMVAGVRVGGWVAWNKPNVPQHPAVNDAMYELAREAA